jgi:5-hydroxyisourate hydrolase-like protein (transthyretin family)
VITGRITGADGQPLIEEAVNVSRMDQQVELSPVRVTTDDRGIYRAFGLRRGKYRVSVGKTERVLPGQKQRIYRQTYYPSVTEPEKATLLDVSEASEIRDIDIATGPPVSTFKATGRIIESETGKPMRDVLLSVARIEGNMSFSSVGATGSDQHGEFRVENLIPGKYQLFPFSETSNWRAETLTFDVVDRDVTSLEIKTQRAASVSGIVVVKDYDEKSVAVKFDRFDVFAFVDNPSTQYGGGRAARLRPDGSFMIVGLASGNARLGINEAEPGESKQLTIVGIERNGAPVSAGIDLKEGEQVEGIKIFAKSTSVTSVIRGQIQFESGEPLPVAGVTVRLARLDETSTPLNLNMPLPMPQVDSRGRFMVQGLAAGAYEISVGIYKPGERTFEVTKQQVTVTTGGVSDVTVTLKPKP